jgi:hypothetical protein
MRLWFGVIRRISLWFGRKNLVEINDLGGRI